MAERVVKVKLTATMDQYVAAMGQAAKATREVGSEGAKLAQTKQAFDMVGRSALALGGLAAAGIGVAVAKFADFDQAISKVAATGEDAKGSIDALRDASLKAGATTVFTATESANAVEELAKAGVSAADILGGGLAGSLDLASAGGLGVADAAGIAATAMQIFKLKGDQASHVADLLAAGAGKAMGDVSDLAMALNQAGLVAESTGLSIEETTAALSAFASKGLIGSDAGTSFKSMLQRLTPQSAEAKKKMDELGISAYDAGGQFIGLEAFSGNLQDSLKGLTDEQRNSALATIFGSDAVRAANVLYEEGAAGIAEWTDSVDDAGYAAETAATKLDNLKGDWEALTGAVDSALIASGSAADGPLRALVQGLTGVVDVFNGMPDAGKQAVFWLGAAGTAVTLAGGIYLLGIPKIAAYNAALETMGTTAQRTGKLLGAAGKGIGIATALVVGLPLLVEAEAALSGLSRRAEEAITKNKSLAESLKLVGEGVDFENLNGAFEGLVKIQENGFNRISAVWDGSVEKGIDLEALLGDLNGEFSDLAASNLPAAKDQFQEWAKSTDGSKEQLLALLNALPGFRDKLQDAARASGGLATDQELLSMALSDGETATKDNKVALEELQGVAADTTTAVGTLEDAIRNFGTAQFDVEQSSLDFQDALAGLTATLTDGDGNFVGSLDKTSEAGRNTLGAMLDVAQSTNDYAASVAAMGGSTAEVQGILEAGRQKIIDTRISLGDTEEAAKAYADQLILTPENIETAVKLTGVDAAEYALTQLARDRFTTITVNSVGPTAGAYSFPVPGNADGGAVYGPGSGRSDSVLRRLSNGEHVWTAAEVQAAGGQDAVYAMRRSVMQYGTAGVGSSSSSTQGSAVIYVQNPFTGEYLLAQTAQVADGRIASADDAAARAFARGRANR